MYKTVVSKINKVQPPRNNEVDLGLPSLNRNNGILKLKIYPLSKGTKLLVFYIIHKSTLEGDLGRVMVGSGVGGWSLFETIIK